MIVEVARAPGEEPGPEWDAAVERWDLPRCWVAAALTAAARVWPAPVITARLVEAGETVALACYRPHVRLARRLGRRPAGPAALARPVVDGLRSRLGQRLWLCCPPASVEPGLAWAPGVDAVDRRRLRPIIQRRAMERAPVGPELVAYPWLDRTGLAEHPTARLTVRTTPVWSVDLEWSSFDGYLASLPRKRRYKFRRLLRDVERRDLRRFDPDGERTISGDGFSLIETRTRQRYQSPGWEALPFPTDYLEAIRRPGHTGAFGYVDAAGRPLRANLGLRTGSTLICSASGGEDPSRADGLYHAVILDQLRWAIDAGLARYTLGPGADDAKRHLGGRAEPAFAAFHPQR